MSNRYNKSIKNVRSGIASKIILILFAFLTRTIFVRLLGAEYVGVNGLYSNILSVLSLAELGIGNVLTFNLYQAFKNNDQKHIYTLVNSFKKIYTYIALSVLVLGLTLVPFLGYIVNSELPQSETLIYYLLFLLNSISSYFVVYKINVIIADQKYYIKNISTTIFTLLMYILQIIYLLFTKDFLGFLIIQIVCNIGDNLALNYIANRQYPFLKNKSLIDVTKVNNKEIIDNIKATFIYKISAVLTNNTDNILISIMLGTVYVGYYSNYYTLILYITSFISIVSTGILASIGDLNAENDSLKSYKMFKNLGLMYNIIATLSTASFLSVVQDFVPIWIGEEYLLSSTILGSLLFVFYITTSTSPIWIFRETLGLFKEVRLIMVTTMILNIVLSIVLGLKFGMAGILLATGISKLATHYWYEPLILYNTVFKIKVIDYFITQFKYLIYSIICFTLSYGITSYLPGNLLFIPVKLLITLFIVLSLGIILNYKTDEFAFFHLKFKNIFSKYYE